MLDTYKTLTKASAVSLYKKKESKFYGLAFPVKSENEILKLLKEIRTKHHKARHWCYAWRLGAEKERFRIYDDGEPNNSAGQPIYRQILSMDLTNVLVVVVRYFGGIKLGAGGLVIAYKTAAQLALQSTDVTIKTIDYQYILTFNYKDINKVQRNIKRCNAIITEQKLTLDCRYHIRIRKSRADELIGAFKTLARVKIERI